MRCRSSRYSPLVAAAAATVGFGFVGQAFGAYTLTNIVSVPYASTDVPGGTIPTTYTTLQPASLTGGVYTDGGYTVPLVGVLNGATTSNSNILEYTAYAYDPTNGFRLIGDYTETSTGAHSNTAVKNVNDVGQVIGTSAANSPLSSAGGALGTSAWLYSTVGNTEQFLPGLTGANYGYTSSVGTVSYSTPYFINDSGQVVGTTSRLIGGSGTGNSGSLGASAWIYTPGNTPGSGTTTQIGLTDSNHYYVSGNSTASGVNMSSGVSTLNGNGQAAGTSNNYFDRGNYTSPSLGQDGWFYSGGTSTPIGLYYSGSDPAGLTGYHYYGTPTGTVGTTPLSSQVRSTSIAGMNTTPNTAPTGSPSNSTGQVIGYSSVYAAGSSVGYSQDAFRYTPTGSGTGTYQQVGLLSTFPATGIPAAGTTAYTNITTSSARSSTPNFINSSGQVAGTSVQYVSNGTSNGSQYGHGTSAWVTDTTGAISTQIGLFGQASDPLAAVHLNPTAASSYSTGLATSSVTQLTNSGYVAGTSTRYSSTGGNLGQDAWVYDPNTKIDNLVGPSDDNTTTYVSTTIAYLSEDGYAVGEYADTGSTTAPTYLNPASYQAFVWSEANGFVALDQTLSPSLSASGYQNLINAYFDGGAGGTIYAVGSTIAGGGTSQTQNGLVALTGTVPEPASIASVLGLGGVGLLRRRRRSAVK